MSSEQRLDLLRKDQLEQRTDVKFLDLSSGNRDKSIDPSSNDVTYVILKYPPSIEVEQFEIPYKKTDVFLKNIKN